MPPSTQIATLTVMRGEHERLPALLENISWASEIHLVDTSERPPDPSWAPHAKFHHAPLKLGAAFDAARGAALPHVQSPWILVIDTDEQVPASLREHLERMAPDWTAEGVEGVWLPRRSHVLTHPLAFSSSWPDYQLRFLRRDRAEFSNKLHGGMPALRKTVKLEAKDELALLHYNFTSTEAFLSKINLYSSIEADQAESPSGAGIGKALAISARDFATRLLKMKGYRDGAAGVHYAVLMAFYRYLAEVKKWERSQPR